MHCAAAALVPTVDIGVDEGWEERADAALTHLLRTTLAKNAKEASTVPSSLTFPKDPKACRIKSCSPMKVLL
jgi:PTHB1-like protein involved in ciliary biogenesis